MTQRRSVGKRRRRTTRLAAILLTSVALLSASVVGVVTTLTALSDLTPEPQTPPRCFAHLDGTDWTLSPDQAQNAALFAAMAAERGLPARAVTIAIATALQESRMVNIDYGDRDSIGLFQQRPSQGWGSIDQIMDPVYSTGKFYDGLVTVPGYRDAPVTVAAQAVQRSAFPDAYAQHETRARAWASGLTGHSREAITCTLPAAAPATRNDAANGAAGLDGAAGVDAIDADRTAQRAADLRERVSRDFPSLKPRGGPDPGVLVLDVAPLLRGSDTSAAARERLAYAVAQWAVATANDHGIIDVTVGGRSWTRSDGTWGEAIRTRDNKAASDAPAGEDANAGDDASGALSSGLVVVRVA